MSIRDHLEQFLDERAGIDEEAIGHDPTAADSADEIAARHAAALVQSVGGAPECEWKVQWALEDCYQEMAGEHPMAYGNIMGSCVRTIERILGLP